MFFLLNSNLSTDSLKYIQNMNDNIDAVRRIVDVSNSTIANEISAVNIMLVAFTIVFGIVGVFLGIYISWLQRKVSKMSDNIEEKEKKIVSLAKAVQATESMIQSDISGLYEKLRKEETLELLRRLEVEPKDITNLLDILLARSLEDDGFPILKNAYLKLISLGDEADERVRYAGASRKQEYLLLFFQHYMYLSIQDDDLRNDIVKEFDYVMACAFKRDIIKTTEDFCKALSVKGASFHKKSLLIDYLKALNNSKYCNLIELEIIIQENTNKDLLVDAIDQCTSEKVYLEMFRIEAPIKSEDKKDSDEEKTI